MAIVIHVNWLSKCPSPGMHKKKVMLSYLLNIFREIKLGESISTSQPIKLSLSLIRVRSFSLWSRLSVLESAHLRAFRSSSLLIGQYAQPYTIGPARWTRQDTMKNKDKRFNFRVIYRHFNLYTSLQHEQQRQLVAKITIKNISSVNARMSGYNHWPYTLWT